MSHPHKRQEPVSGPYTFPTPTKFTLQMLDTFNLQQKAHLHFY